MKKFLFLLALLLPGMVFAECDVINDTSTGNDRTLTCDKSLATVTKYSVKDKQVLNNGVCTVTCSEEVIFSFDPIKKVIAGMGFSYPLRASGERKCSATYNYAAYNTQIRNLVNTYESTTGDAKTTAKNEIVNYYAKKQACDEFNKEESDYKNEYKYIGDVTLEIETSTKIDKIKYQFVETEDRAITESTDEIYYDSCELNPSNYSCIETDKAMSSWTSSTRIFGKYTMPYVYVEKYTGEIKNSATETTCNAQDKYFTDFKEYSKPLSNEPTDNGYKLTLTATNLGNNLELAKSWNLEVNCFYQVKNLSFPQGGNGVIEDEEYDLLGNTGFMYRIIDLNNPFPDRDAFANWKGKESIIYSTKDNITSLQKFIINLNRTSINKVKQYNQNYSYDTFNLNEMEKSDFIINNTDIIDRK